MRQWWVLLVLGSLAWTAGPRRPAATRVEIEMRDSNQFVPEPVTVTAGDTVEWVNVGELPHTSTDEPGASGVPGRVALPAGAKPWDSALVESGKRFSVVLTVPGEYRYVCTIHEGLGMVGKLVVRPRR